MEETYEKNIRTSPIAYAYHRLLLNTRGEPEDYIFLDINPSFEKMIGLKAENIIGKKVTEVIPSIREGEFDWIKFYGNITLKNKNHEFVQFSKEFKRWYKILVFWPKKEHFVTIFHDITREMKVIKELEEKQKRIEMISNRYKILFEKSPDGIVYFDKNHKVLDVNETFQKIFKYKKKDCIGKNLDDIVVPKTKRFEAEDKTRQLFKKGEVDVEAIRYTKYGEPVHVNIRGILMEKDGQVVEGYGIYTDITEKEKYKRNLEDVNRELENTICQLTASEQELRAQYTEIQEYAERNQELKQKYEIAIKSTDSFIWEINIKNEIIHLSENFMDITGIQLETKKTYEVINKVVHNKDKKALISEFEKYIRGEIKEVHTQIRIRDKYGKLRWYLVKGSGIKDRDGKIKSVHGVLIEITNIKSKEEYIKYFAEHDPLTRIYNRRKFNEILDKELQQGKRGVVFLLDLDNFKNINDTLGHVYGDKLLKKIGNILKDIGFEKCDSFRFGGDEFLLLIREIEDIQRVKNYAQKLLQRLQEKIVIDDIENTITASIGIVRYPQDGQNIDEILKKADITMYKAKHTGKNKYLIFNEEMKTSFNEKISIEKILRKALKENIFTLLYQPIIETNTGKIVSFEVLIRLKNANISPAIFIPIAEQTDLILPIGRWVIKEAIKQLRIWRDKGYSLKPIAINLSPRQFYDKRLVRFLHKTLREYNIEPSLLEIEVTENVLVENKRETIEKIENLKKMGIKIALDDFGTGYSSLNYLTFIPIDKIKLDKSLKDKFIKLEKIQIIDSLISIAHGLNIKVVAEGVEEIEEYKRLKKSRSDYLQGYLFSKPITKEEVEKIFDKNYSTLLL